MTNEYRVSHTRRLSISHSFWDMKTYPYLEEAGIRCFSRHFINEVTVVF